jgi:hypothetical protein
MKQFISAAASLLFATSALAQEKRDLCSDGSTDDGGNWYCQEVQAITYTGVGGSGSYNKVNSMNSGSGTCTSSPFGYSGTMSPLDEEVRKLNFPRGAFPFRRVYHVRTLALTTSPGIVAFPWSFDP